MRFRELGRELLRRGVKVTYIVDERPENRPETLKIDERAAVLKIPAGGLIYQTQCRRRLIHEKNFDFVHILNTSPKTFAATVFRGSCKLVADWDEWPARRSGLPVYRAISEKTLDIWQRKFADVRVVCSRFMQEEFAKLGTPAVYIPYASYLENRSEPPNPFTEPTLVYLGALHAAWDHDILFYALKILQQRGKSIPFCFMGGGPELQKWTQWVKAEKLTNVKVMGFVPDEPMWAHLRHAHALLFPIRPNIINVARCPAKAFAYAQAMRPVITCRVGEVPAVLGEEAQYIENSTPEAFADAMQAILDQPRLPDIDYHVERQSWALRADALLNAISTSSLDQSEGLAQ